ncbi:cyclin-A1 isoform X2 [Girardinichthys multiradiatus]|uniref:cyclin-A1 isoform X2 n=1 Tax=Girardinichthys multiradiatus TaxID=208333 RepID=UPI001FAE4D00|nr:cyclin-A1 isoform X2 [Girardinichthys multiradiatus]
MLIMMNFSTNSHRHSPTHKENIPPPTKADAFQHQRTKQRTVLGVLSENEQRGRSLSQGSQFSKHSSVSDSSQLNFFGCPSSSSYEVYVEEACEVVLGASGQEVVSDSYDLTADAYPLQNEHLDVLMEFSSSSCQDASMQFEPDEPLMSVETFCFDYAEDIYKNLRESEKFRAKPAYLEKHPEITNAMRVVLVDWLVEVVQEYKLGSETLHLAVNYLDRFLSCTTFIKRNKLQLVGTVALLVAAKYEEIFPPELNEFVYITDCTYSKKQLLRMESVLLKMLDFKMAAPTTNQFLRLFISVHPICSTTKNLALYIAELSLLESDPFLQYTPSILAAGAYCLAAYTINKSYWPDSLVVFTGYTMEEIMPCLTYLHKLYISAETRPQQAVRAKYKTSKYCHVSGITAPTAMPFP